MRFVDMKLVKWKVYRPMLCLLLCTFLVITFKILIFNRILYLDEDIPLPYPPAMTKDMPIPKIIHQTWKSRSIPQQFVKWIGSWRKNHPDWQYWFWTDEDCRRLIKERFPKFLQLYDSYPVNINRADVIRYFILYEFGGVYIDLDLESITPLDSLINSKEYGSCFLSQEPLEHSHWYWNKERIVCNAAMACRKQHPFFGQILSELQHKKGWSLFFFIKINPSVMSSTGPLMVTDVFNSYNTSLQPSLNSKLDKMSEVKILPSYFFFPTIDPDRMVEVKARCTTKPLSSLSPVDRSLCQWHIKTHFSNPIKPSAYANHHWVHTYYHKDTNKPIETDIKDIIGDAIFFPH